MKITKDDDGYAIVDFEGLEVVCYGFGSGPRVPAINQLFNENRVSQVNNGIFIFKPFTIDNEPKPQH